MKKTCSQRLQRRQTAIYFFVPGLSKRNSRLKLCLIRTIPHDLESTCRQHNSCAGLLSWDRSECFPAGHRSRGTPPLFSVAHDATLTGSGVTNNPLGVASGGIGTGQLANGAVTLPKLSISGSPATGTVVGYNGSGLAWQAASGGAQVVDSVGHSYPVQITVTGAYGAVWQTGGETFVIPIATTTSLSDVSFNLLYSSFDCSGQGYFQGPPYVVDPSTLLFQQPSATFGITGSTLYYATGRDLPLQPNSYNLGPGTTCTPQGNTQTGVRPF